MISVIESPSSWTRENASPGAVLLGSVVASRRSSQIARRTSLNRLMHLAGGGCCRGRHETGRAEETHVDVHGASVDLAISTERQRLGVRASYRAAPAEENLTVRIVELCKDTSFDVGTFKAFLVWLTSELKTYLRNGCCKWRIEHDPARYAVCFSHRCSRSAIDPSGNAQLQPLVEPQLRHL